MDAFAVFWSDSLQLVRQKSQFPPSRHPIPVSGGPSVPGSIVTAEDAREAGRRSRTNAAVHGHDEIRWLCGTDGIMERTSRMGGDTCLIISRFPDRIHPCVAPPRSPRVHQ